MADPVNPLVTPIPVAPKKLTDDQKKILDNIKKAAVDGGKFDADKAKVALKVELKKVGTSDEFVDVGNAAEEEFLADLLNGDAGAEFVPFQTALKKTVEGDATIFKGKVSDAKVDKASSDYEADPLVASGEKLVAKPDEPGRTTPPADAPTIKNIQNARSNWRVGNAGNTFAIDSKDLKSRVDAIANRPDLAGKDIPTKLRAVLKEFWNNDGANVKFISVQELEAIRAWGESLAGKDKDDFMKNFKEQFLISVKEDTPFSVELMARQWTEIMGSSKFTGKDSEKFVDFFKDFGKGIAQGVVASKPAGTFKAGDTIAAFNGKNEHKGFDNVLFKVGADGTAIDIDISKSSMGDMFKIGYDFGGKGAIDPAGGFGGDGGPIKKLKEKGVKAVNDGIGDVNTEKGKIANADAKKKAEGINIPVITDTSSLADLTKLKGSLQSLAGIADIGDGLKTKITNLLKLVEELIKEREALDKPAPPVPAPKPDNAKPLTSDADVEKITKGDGGIDGITKDINALADGDPKKAAAKLILDFPMITKDSTVKDLKALKVVLDKFNAIDKLDDKIKDKIKALIAQIDKLITP